MKPSERLKAFEGWHKFMGCQPSSSDCELCWIEKRVKTLTEALDKIANGPSPIGPERFKWTIETARKALGEE